MPYELWEKSTLSGRRGLPVNTCYTLDAAMRSAETLSKGTTKQQIYNPKKVVPGVKWPGGYDEVDIPKAFAVIERGGKQSVVRGWGINGKWYDARDCKRCQNTGRDSSSWNEPCTSCCGSSYKPRV